MITRKIEQTIKKLIDNPTEKRIIFVWGPRRAGKSTILKQLALLRNSTIFNFDILNDQSLFTAKREDLQKLSLLDYIFIDEVQNHPESTIALKILHDEFAKKILATGSTELRQVTGKDFDSLAGRYVTLYCFPLMITEVGEYIKFPLDPVTKVGIIEQTLRFGGYPEVYLEANEDEKIRRLEEIIDTYILKDIISIYNLKDVTSVKNLLIKLALQIGSETSPNQLAGALQIDKNTISNYISILIKNNIIIALSPFATNIKKTLVKPKKYYFLDLGIRNALIQDFRPVDLRQDKGAIFENLIVSEISKHIAVERKNMNMYFYRDYEGNEVDIILEDYYKQYQSIEIKYKTRSIRNKFPLVSKFTEIDRTNAYDFIESLST